MKKLIYTLFLALGIAGTSFGQNIVGLNSKVEERATDLSMKMAKDLQLNNYQQSRLQAINAEVIAKMAELELKYPNDPNKLDQECRGVCVMRDEKLESVLSTDQYSRYFGAREEFYQYDRRKVAGKSLGKQVAGTNQQPSTGR